MAILRYHGITNSCEKSPTNWWLNHKLIQPKYDSLLRFFAAMICNSPWYHVISILYPYGSLWFVYSSLFHPHLLLQRRPHETPARGNRDVSHPGSRCVATETIGYGSIPINTIFSGMNIHLPAILMFTRGIGFWHTANWKVSWNFRKRTWEIEFPILFQKIGHWTWTFWVEGSVPGDIRRWCTHRVNRKNYEGAQPGCSLDIV